jgi:hypothetical protein
MATPKQAADKKTEDYWTNYFGEYGRMFVREIPRVIKAAVLPDFRRTANGEQRRIEVKASQVVPLGYTVTAENGLHLDGVVRMTVAEKGELRTAQRLFHAEFNADGDLAVLNTRKAPVA